MMNLKLVGALLDMKKSQLPDLQDRIMQMTPPIPPPVENKSVAYTSRHRGVWFKPEYDFEEIQIAQDTDSYFSRSVIKKLNKIIVAGFDFVGNNAEPVEYIRTRIKEIGYATKSPFEKLVWDTFYDLFRYNNCMWAKVRSEESSSGNPVQVSETSILPPIAGYYILPFETLEFKTKTNGDLKKVLQRNDAREREWFPRDVVHFYTNRKPGFLVGTPEVLPVLEDIAFLRHIEDNIMDLIETNLYPVYHYKIGTDEMPERYTKEGVKESDLVRQKLQYMPAHGFYVSDHRHEITSLGSEGKALRIDFYVNHFKNRVLSGLGTSALDMGEGDTANRSTAGTLTKGMLMDIEAMAKVVKTFIEFYVISELLIEGGYNPLDSEDMVYIKFGVIDKDDRRADENQQIQMFTNNVRTMDEIRKSLGDEPFTEEHLDRTHQKMFAEPLALLKSIGPGSAASLTLAEHPSSSITPEAVKAETSHAEQQQKEQNKIALARVNKPAGRPVSRSNGGARTSASKARPSNQHGTRASAKTVSDVRIEDTSGKELVFTCDFEIDFDKLDQWKKTLYKQYREFDGAVSLETLAKTTIWRLEKE